MGGTMNGKRPGGWVALAWRYYRDEKMLAVSADAELLYGHALAFAGEGETDGRVPVVALGLLASKLVGSAAAAAAELVAAGLWDEDGRNYVIRNWDRWQDTAEQRRAGRARDAKRKAVARVNADTTRDSAGDSPEDYPEGQLEESGVGRGRGRGRGSTSTDTPDPCPPGRERDFSPPEGQEPGPTRPRWEEFTDDHGRLFVRPSTNGPAEP